MPFPLCVCVCRALRPPSPSQSATAAAAAAARSVNAVPSCANKWLLTTIARDEWNGKASPIYVTSDCQADSDVFAPHNYTKTPAAAAAAIIKAGQDINCGGFMTAHIGDAIKAGLATVDDVDASIRRALGVRLRLGHFDPPGPLQTIGMAALCDLAAVELARDGAAQGAVLLKNARRGGGGGGGGGPGKGLLPLEAATVGKVAVIGPHTSAQYGKAMGYYYFGAHGCAPICGTNATNQGGPRAYSCQPRWRVPAAQL